MLHPVTYYFIAHKAEAQVYINKYELAPLRPSPFLIYGNDRILLTVTGMGQKAASAAAYTLQKYPPKDSDSIINAGLAGCAKRSIAKGSVYDLAGAVYKDTTLRLRAGELCHSFTAPVRENFEGSVCDMEAFFVLQSALGQVKPRQIRIYKVISDHLTDAAIPSKDTINDYMQKVTEYENSSYHRY
ncbi:MAG: hypothetical protein ACQERK_03565 [Campylobacterota bacterium]